MTNDAIEDRAQRTAHNVMLLLAPGQSSSAFEAQFQDGYRADRFPYGIENLPKPWRPRFIEGGSRPGERSLLGRLVFRVLQLDVAGPLRHRRQLRSAPIVYGHTEQEYLPAALALLLLRSSGPRLVAQTVWLFGTLDRYGRVRRRLTMLLFGRVDLFVHNAMPNLRIASRLLPNARHAYVPFGVSERFLNTTARQRTGPTPLVLSVGGDRARDWDTLRSALEPVAASATIRIASDSSMRGFEFARVGRTRSIAELQSLHRMCACMVIAVHPNAHASGITAILEAAASGTPVIATRTGGLEEYFTDDEVLFVPDGDSEALRAAVLTLIEDPERADRLGERLRNRWLRDDYSNRGYWTRVLEAVDSTLPLKP